MVYGILVVILVTYALYRLVLSFLDVTPDVRGKTVFISGCDSGFGHDLALKCLQHGMTVFAGCLTDEGARNLQTKASGTNEKSGESSSSRHGKLHTIIVDVASDESVENARKEVTSLLNGNGLDGIVNNAGVPAGGLDDWLTVKDYQKVLDVNLLGVIRTTHAFRKLVKKNKGRIVNVSSALSMVALGTLAQYSVSKFAVKAYTDAIRTEYAQFGVTVSVLEPGFFRTPLAAPAENVQRLKKLVSNLHSEVREEYGEEYFEKTIGKTQGFLDGLCSPKTYLVVDAYFHALTSKYPRVKYHVGWDYYLFFFLSLWPAVARDYLQYFAAWISGVPKPKGAR
ncbi:unnamed protein product [Bursaphelenchus xylophilus]|uniref:(pine wood nematode) hypothetical protein n=1 Tax=Bursaphelenchus xylophilus TaxID=6326 RepID=A0A1I7RJT5_BURXY|nr:unnamed protein product [Bursaphelenchus xylophilus]CAG9129057.1 unnamed protein product [Bursaphelenchus xylophilus]